MKEDLKPYQHIIDKYGDSWVRFLDDILHSRIGRYNLSKLTNLSDWHSKEVCRLVHEVRKRTPEQNQLVQDRKEVIEEIESNPEFAEMVTGLMRQAQAEGIPIASIRHFWFKSKNYSIFAKHEADPEEIYRRFENVVAKFIHKPRKPYQPQPVDEKKALIATKTDAHLGMNPNPNGDGLFQMIFRSLN
jgi:hypothetical protein